MSEEIEDKGPDAVDSPKVPEAPDKEEDEQDKDHPELFGAHAMLESLSDLMEAWAIAAKKLKAMGHLGLGEYTEFIGMENKSEDVILNAGFEGELMVAANIDTKTLTILGATRKHIAAIVRLMPETAKRLLSDDSDLPTVEPTEPNEPTDPVDPADKDPDTA